MSPFPSTQVFRSFKAIILSKSFLIISQKSFKDFFTNTTAPREQRPWAESFEAGEKYLINDGNKSSDKTSVSIKVSRRQTISKSSSFLKKGLS